jgi:hypothetical protein
MHHILDGTFSQSPNLAQRARRDVRPFPAQVLEIDNWQIEALLAPVVENKSE